MGNIFAFPMRFYASAYGPVIDDCAPATPPGMRVRTGRFEKLRLRESRYSESIKVGYGQYRFH